MSKRWMGFALLFLFFTVPAVHAAETAKPSSSSVGTVISQVLRVILSDVSAMIPPTGKEDDTPPPPGHP